MKSGEDLCVGRIRSLLLSTHFFLIRLNQMCSIDSEKNLKTAPCLNTSTAITQIQLLCHHAQLFYKLITALLVSSEFISLSHTLPVKLTILQVVSSLIVAIKSRLPIEMSSKAVIPAGLGKVKYQCKL